MIPVQSINSYLQYRGLEKVQAIDPSAFDFRQPFETLNVNKKDEVPTVETILNTGTFAAHMSQELNSGVFKKAGLLFLNTLKFDLEKEIAPFKQYTGIVNINYGAALYLGGLYHFAKYRDKFITPVKATQPKTKAGKGGDLLKGLSINSDNIPAIIDGTVATSQINKVIALKEEDDKTVYRYVTVNEAGEKMVMSDALRTSLKKYGIGGHGYGVSANLYEEWTKFVADTYVSNIETKAPQDASVLMNGNWSGIFRSFRTGDSQLSNDYKGFEHYATYSILYNNTDMSSVLKKKEGATNPENFTMWLGALKSVLRTSGVAEVKQEIRRTLALNIKGTYIRRFLEHYLAFADNLEEAEKTFPSDEAFIQAVCDKLNYDINTEQGKYSDADFMVSLYPSSGGLFYTDNYFNLELVEDGETIFRPGYQKKTAVSAGFYEHLNANMYSRSARFIWAQGLIPVTNEFNEPAIGDDYIHRSVGVLNDGEKPFDPAIYGIYGKLVEESKLERSTTHIANSMKGSPQFFQEKIQNVMSVVGLHNMEVFEEEFLKWVDTDYKSSFTDKLHFSSTLKAMMFLERSDFTPLENLQYQDNLFSFSVDEQVAMLYGYNYTINGINKGAVGKWLNIFLSNAQHNKLEKLSAVYDNETLVVNNYSTLGMLSSGGYKLLLDNAPFRRELMLSSESLFNSLNKGFLLRKFLFGDQDLPTYNFTDKTEAYRYFNFRPYFVRGNYRAANLAPYIEEFFRQMDVDANNEDILKVVHPVLSFYLFFREYHDLYSGNRFGFDAFVDNHFIKLFNRNGVVKNIYDSFLSAYKSIAFDKLLSKDDADSIIKQTVNETNTLLTYKEGTYYNVRALYDNNLYVPNHSYLRDTTEEPSHASDKFLKQPLFYNYTNQEDCGDPTEELTADKKRPKHLFEYVQVVDRGNRNVGHDILANLMWVREFFGIRKDEKDLTNPEALDVVTSSTYFTFFSKFADHHNCLLHPLSSYTNLAGTQSNGEDVFGTFTSVDKMATSPAFVIQYIGDIESILNNANNKNLVIGPQREKNQQNSFCMDVDFRNGTRSIKDEDIPQDIKTDGAVSCFVVDFGAQNQQVFKNIDIDTSQFTNTEESIKSYVNLTTSANQRQPQSGDLFKILSQRSYSCQVEAMGNVMIQPLSYFYLKNIPLFTGAYWIVNVSHKLEANTMSTTFKGVRQPIAKIPSKNELMIRILETNNEKIAAVETSAVTTEGSTDSGNPLGLTVSNEFRQYKGGSVGDAKPATVKLVMDHFQYTSPHKFTFMQAAAITGHLIQESQLNPRAKNSIGATGLAQWTSSGRRKEKMFDFVGQFETYTSDTALLKKQLEYIDHELDSTEKGALNQLKAATTIGEAIYAFAKFERFKDSDNKSLMLRSQSQKKNIGEWGSRVHYTMNILGSEYKELLVSLDTPLEQSSPEAVSSLYSYLNGRVLPGPLDEAKKLYGVKEAKGRQNNDTILSWAKEVGLGKTYVSDDTAWCGLFMAVTTKRAGFEPVKESLSAKSWATFGEPVQATVLGDIIVSKRTGGHHVGYYVGEDDSTYHLLGGNQSNKVTISKISKQKMVAIRRPKYSPKPTGLVAFKLQNGGSYKEVSLA